LRGKSSPFNCCVLRSKPRNWSAMVKVELGCLGDQFRHAEEFASHKSLKSINPVVCLSASIIIMYSALVRSPLDFHGLHVLFCRSCLQMPKIVTRQRINSALVS
jgi:hypothetical protein